MVGYVGKTSLENVLSARGVSSSLLSKGSMEGLNEICTSISSEYIQLPQSYFVTYRKKLEEVVFFEEEFLHKKIRNKDVYVIIVPWLIFQKMQLSTMVIGQH